MRARAGQAGVTIIELLVGISVGLLVVSGAVAMYSSSIRNSNETLRASKLNQELSALMSVMVNDIRRAGYWENAAPIGNFNENPFSQENATALAVIDDLTSDTLQGPTGQGSCLVYAYDATYLPGDVAGVIDTTDLFGFRLNGTVVQMRQVGVVDGADCIGGTCNSCNNGTWEDVTDPNLIEITNLDFDLANSKCLNASEPNGEDDDADGTIDEADEEDCYATVPPVGSEEATVETREVVITVTGRLAADTSTEATVTQTIRVRNDHLRLR